MMPVLALSIIALNHCPELIVEKNNRVIGDLKCFNAQVTLHLSDGETQIGQYDAKTISGLFYQTAEDVC